MIKNVEWSKLRRFKVSLCSSVLTTFIHKYICTWQLSIWTSFLLLSLYQILVSVMCLSEETCLPKDLECLWWFDHLMWLTHSLSYYSLAQIYWFNVSHTHTHTHRGFQYFMSTYLGKKENWDSHMAPSSNNMICISYNVTIFIGSIKIPFLVELFYWQLGFLNGIS